MYLAEAIWLYHGTHAQSSVSYIRMLVWGVWLLNKQGGFETSSKHNAEALPQKNLMALDRGPR